MHSVCVSSQLLVSVLFIVVPTNTENTNLFFVLVCVLFLVMQLHVHNRKHATLICTGSYDMVAGLYKV